MMTYTRLAGLSGKADYAVASANMIQATTFSMSPPMPTASPPGYTPGNIATQPTVTVVQGGQPPGPVAYPPTQPPPDAPLPPPGGGFIPDYAPPGVVTLGPATKKAWVPWAIGGGIVAAIGTAIVVAVANR